ncbi:MAG: methyl-accepting chemotaxis protein, partial [Lacisediminimonas sp.]|nr:methyl-accepting chemotaxis protein [Lacisediminimonas sp.]
ILLGYLAPLLLLLAVMVLVFINLGKAENQNALAEATYTNLHNGKDLILALIKMQRSSRGYLLQKNPTSHETFQRASNEFKESAELLDREINDPAQRDTLKQIVELGQTLNKVQQEEMALVDAGMVTEAIAEWEAEDFPIAREAEDLLDKFEQRENELLQQRQETYHAALNTVSNSIIYGMLGSIALAIAIALWLAVAISRNITANAAQLSAAASEIAATINQHERTASQQAAAANETSATIEELSASSRQSADQAASAAAVAEKVSAATVQGGDATHQAVVAMSGLKDKIAAMADQILRLGEQTAQIGSIASLVKELSGQINMLALNAAVEAARAGEHGIGFAVVASEVRKLADQSKKSAEQATALVADIQKSTNSSIMMTEEGTHTVAEVTQLAQKVAELFNNLSGMAGSVNENAQQVMLNAKQQSAAFTQVVEATNSISAGAKETAAGISQTKIGVQKLNEAAENLRAIA